VITGSGPQTQALLPPLPDGEYTFSVSQVTSFGAKGVEATRSFEVDTVAPPAPIITARPAFPTSSATPGFTWSVEPGSFSRWRVVGAGGNALQASDTPLTSATVGPLGSGAYNFRVAQVDAAGNESASAVEAFSIVGAVAARRKAPLSLPKQNAGRLRPRAGKRVLTRRPVLRWRGGPDATVYNLQVFRVLRKRTVADATPPVKKIYSVFPTKRRYKMPKAKMLPGTCYVWRVWPFVGRRFTGKPLGVSNFCVASRKALRQKAAAQRRAARSR
jgi:predicted phage tail protein